MAVAVAMDVDVSGSADTRARYLPLVPVLIVLANIPDYSIRLHHYLYALIAIPVLSLPNRVSLAGQAFMLGIFLDGVGRWGWDGLIEYSASVRRPPPFPSCASRRSDPLSSLAMPFKARPFLYSPSTQARPRCWRGETSRPTSRALA